jgi:hypothetical protein
MMNRPVPSSDKKGSSGRARTYNPQVNSDAGSTRQVIDFATPRSFSKLGRAQDSVNYFYDYLSFLGQQTVCLKHQFNRLLQV